jgi:EAL domain-containing protein (putative c-di-GMP-specific phosphodiesterase class I)
VPPRLALVPGPPSPREAGPGRGLAPAAAPEPHVAPAPSARGRNAPTPIPFQAFDDHQSAPPPRTVGLDDARAILDQGRFWTEYQAIVQARDARTVAYEALARFLRKDGRLVAPSRLFKVLHADPALLLRAELTLKLHQVEHAPRHPLFVNIDPDSWVRAGDRNCNPFLALLTSSPRRVVVEVTEAMALSDAARAREMIEALRGRRLPIALDDVGATNALLTFDALADAEVLKFDRTLVPRLKSARVRALVKALTQMARQTGAHTVLEGVETTADFVLARDLGFELVQGFLFRDRAQYARR